VRAGWRDHSTSSSRNGDHAGFGPWLAVPDGNGEPRLRLYFDEQSGLLLRILRYSESPLGLNPTRIDYADYRSVDGVQVPYRWTVARPGGQFTIQITEVKQNGPISQEKFARPSEAEHGNTDQSK